MLRVPYTLKLGGRGFRVWCFRVWELRFWEQVIGILETLGPPNAVTKLDPCHLGGEPPQLEAIETDVVCRHAYHGSKQVRGSSA